MHNYHDTALTFPAGIYWFEGGTCGKDPRNPSIFVAYNGWSVRLLPFLEQSEVLAMIDAGGVEMQLGSMNHIPAYLCPSDPQTPELAGYSSVWPGPSPEEDVSVTNYAGVADAIDFTCDGYANRLDGDGVLFNNSRVRIGDITDGTSQTLVVGEIVGRGEGSHSGLPWLTHTIYDTHNGINRWVPAIVIYHNSAQTGFASYHPGGCHFMVADASVHFLSEHVDAHVLRSLTTRNGMSHNGIGDVIVNPNAFWKYA